MSAARSLLTGSPDPLPVWVDVHGEDGKKLFSINARTRASAWQLVLDAPKHELAVIAYFDEAGSKSRVYRDAVTRQWRSK
jgi:hypothetical protein